MIINEAYVPHAAFKSPPSLTLILSKRRRQCSSSSSSRSAVAVAAAVANHTAALYPAVLQPLKRVGERANALMQRRVHDV